MIEQLFGSKTRVKLLRLFYSSPNRSFYVREITRKIDEQINSVRRELANMLNIGIIVSDTTNHRLYYEVNQQYNFYKPLLAIFGEANAASHTNESGVSVSTAKPSSSESTATREMKPLGHLEVVIYTGQFTRDESGGVDILLVGDINQNAVSKYITELEAQEGKELRYVVMPMSEFDYRRQIKDRFITTVLDSKKQVILDTNGILPD
ncbi:MAG TPA: transcriptional regulator [Candidatus Saccharimonadales bacterium]|nr:transcriptional regulator [Candidatus Saccharimonadales bacterium]